MANISPEFPIGAAMQPDTIADRILDRIHAAVREKLPEIRGRTITELTVLFGDLREQIADVLADTNVEED
jgi:hypothetical protein